MYCRICGSKLEDDAQFCPYCGTHVSVAENENAAASSANLSSVALSYQDRQDTAAKKRNGWGIAGFVLALVSILGSMLLSILGIIFSAIGTAHRRNYTSCNGLAKAGLIISVITVAVWIVVLIVAFAVAFAVA